MGDPFLKRSIAFLQDYMNTRVRSVHGFMDVPLVWVAVCRDDDGNYLVKVSIEDFECKFLISRFDLDCLDRIMSSSCSSIGASYDEHVRKKRTTP